MKKKSDTIYQLNNNNKLKGLLIFKYQKEEGWKNYKICLSKPLIISLWL